MLWTDTQEIAEILMIIIQNLIRKQLVLQIYVNGLLILMDLMMTQINVENES